MNADAELDKYDDYETENERDEPSSTKKAKKIYLHKYNSEWENGEYKKWIKRSNKGIHYFHCKICTSDYIGGLAAVKKHAASMKHTKNAKAVNIQMSVTNMPFIKNNNVLNTQIKRAELKIAAFITEHNIAFNTAEHLVKLIKNISSEPEVVKNIQCNRTKCTSIVKNVIGQTVFEETIAKLKIYKFSIIVDESTDHSCIKNLAMVARFSENFKINDTFLTLLPIVDGSALALHSTIVNFFDKFEIPYKKNMIGFGADGANVMMGENHSLKTMLTNDVLGLFVLKCTCHSLALCASYACLKLPRGPEDFVRDIHSYMKYSFKRTSEFREFQQFVDAKPHKLLLPAQTR